MKNTIIRTIYLYLFALLGLVLLTIAGVRFIDMGLKAYVFTKADDEQKIYFRQPPMTLPLEKSGEISNAEYEEWQKEVDQINPVTSSRHRDASINLSMILIGLPLYLYHWGVIRKETKNKS